MSTPSEYSYPTERFEALLKATRRTPMPVSVFGSHESSLPSPSYNDENYSPSE